MSVLGTHFTLLSCSSRFPLLYTHFEFLCNLQRRGMAGNMGDETSLGHQVMLSKIDKLRELNVGSIIPLPQASRQRQLTTPVVNAPARRCRRPVLGQELCPRKPHWLFVPARSRPMHALRNANYLRSRCYVQRDNLHYTPSRCQRRPQDAAAGVSSLFGRRARQRRARQHISQGSYRARTALVLQVAHVLY